MDRVDELYKAGQMFPRGYLDRAEAVADARFFMRRYDVGVKVVECSTPSHPITYWLEPTD